MTTEPPPPDPAVIDALMTATIARHGERLGDEGRARVREQVERLRQAVAALDAHHLENGDEPDASFRAVERLDRI